MVNLLSISNMKKTLFRVITGLVLWSALSIETWAYQLFSNGRTHYSIVVAKDASPSELHAAKELQTILHEISGATFELTHNLQAKGKHIYIGHNPKTQQLFGIEPADEHSDRFTYLSEKGQILIYGSHQRGTMYGVYAFLENELGVRWFTEDETKIPKRETYSFEKLSHTETPAIAIRHVMYKETEDAAWSAHNRMNGGDATLGKAEWGGADAFWGIHTIGKLLPAKELFDQHPDYFALREGKRVPDAQLCLTHPEVLRLATERLLKQIEQHPHYKVYDMSQNDSWGDNACQCERCQALAKKFGAESGVWVWFVNQVAAAVKERFPDKMVGTFAYRYTRKPPVGITPADNVVIRLCSIECCFAHSLESCPEKANQHFLEDVKAWAQLAPHLFIWDYVTSFSHYLIPYPNFNALAPNISTYQQHHAIGIMEEGQYETKHGEFSELRAYVLAKLLWNPTLSVQDLVSEFIEGYYGKAAETVMSHYEQTMALVNKSTHFTIYPKTDDPIYTDTYVREALERLTKAKAACHDPQLRQRVEHIWLSPAYLFTQRNFAEAKQTGIFDELVRICRRDGIGIRECADIELWVKEMTEKKNEVK